MNIKPSDLSAKELYLQGRDIEKREHEAKESTKIGTLRGGSSGCIAQDGEIYGTCHRKALARFNGHQSEIEEISYTWFDAGYANEEAWIQKLTKSVEAMGPNYQLKAEEECPIEWEVDGTKVTGRPDIMVFKNEKPILGLELKVVCAVNAAVNIYCEDKPKIENLLQAAHYSMIHNCPFTLVYSFRNRSRVPGWAERHKDKLNLSYEKTFTNSKTGKSFTKREYTIEPFTKEFKIGFEDGHIYFVRECGEKVLTDFTADGIKAYYAMIVDMSKNQHLADRPSTKDLYGAPLPYNLCNYCPFQDACDQFENDYQSWLDKISLICS